MKTKEQKTGKSLKKQRGKVDDLQSLLLKGPTWTKEQYKEWLKEKTDLHKWKIR
jgi:hypothetical protein